MGKVAVGIAVVCGVAVAAAAAVVVHRRKEVGEMVKVMEIVKDFEEQCATPVSRLKQVSDAMIVEMHAGLASEGGSKLKMLISYVDNLPTGYFDSFPSFIKHEYYAREGLFYALDLGGTNFRVLRLQLGGRGRGILNQQFVEVSIPPNLMTGTSNQNLLNSLLRKARIMNHILVGRGSLVLPSHSCDANIHCFWHTSSGQRLLHNDAVGQDVVAELTEAMERNGLDMRVSALVNDTVGTLAGARFVNNDAAAAVILGTGSNAAYVEHANAIPKWHGPLPRSGEMVINMEWGNFKSAHLPLSEYDLEMDAESLNPGEQIYEKVLSGMYLGEIVRRVLCWLAQEAAFFGDTVPPKLKVPFALGTPAISAMHQDTSPDLKVVSNRFKDLFEISNTSLQMRKVIVQIATLSTRGARLALAGILSILRKMEGIRSRTEKQRTVVAWTADYTNTIQNTLSTDVLALELLSLPLPIHGITRDD
ncbi:Hexokinase-1 [Hibiscus syriacus]|uniref:Phosphotransferase n=1 Tax=Hibiscus syriacus TaxID=106335 RepID=A0A6A3AMA6_HIBSY|nr:Hexokinase-1 [Hibiscus syriacus]